MTYEKIKRILALHQSRMVIETVIFISLAGCLSVPPEVVRLHQQEQQIIQNLRVSHLALADAYMDKRLEEFECFFFHEYGPVFFEKWSENFKAKKGRPYDPEKDFGLLYNDLIAVYQTESTPIAEMRTQLRDSIAVEYQNTLDAHQALGEWLEALKKLSDAQRQAIDQVLDSFQPGLSLAKFDKKVDDVTKKLLSQTGAE